MKIFKFFTILVLTLVFTLFQTPQETVSISKESTPSKKTEVRNLSKVKPVSFKSWITAYSSTYNQTDSTPFITASGERVRKGIVATNLLPFGTKIKIPRLFGDKVFVVKDRMHPRKDNTVDIWMKTTKRALKFGKKYSKIKIVETPNHQLTLLQYY
ncbi:MAG: hypothetical protein ABEI53_00950 [Candidatus Magasanikbacteria bacterium]